MRKKIINNWRSKTPKLAKFFQAVSGALAALPLYYQALPDEFKASISPDILKYITIAGGLSILALQLLKTKEKK